MRISADRKNYIVDLAEEVVCLHSPGTGAADLNRILIENEIGWHFDYYGDAFDGMIEVEAGEFFIHGNLDKCKSPVSGRARFTLGHELGHFFIDEHRLALLQGVSPHPSVCGMFDNSECAEEFEADVFSANLLMPPSRFVSAAEGNSSPLMAIKSLAKSFKSSITATAIQYSSVAADRCAIIKWNPDGTFAWRKIGDAYFKEGFRNVRYKDPAQIIDGSATEQVLSGKAGDAETVSTMAHVFSHVAQQGMRNHLIREETMALGSYGFLTIFSDLESG